LERIYISYRVVRAVGHVLTVVSGKVAFLDVRSRIKAMRDPHRWGSYFAVNGQNEKPMVRDESRLN
jgi:hypothetical protein